MPSSSAHELGVADLRGKPEQRGRLLRVEHGRERHARQRQERLDVLARRVQQLQARRVREQRRQRAAVRDRERIDEGDVVRGGGLDQAQPRVIRPLAHELGVERERAAAVPRPDASLEQRSISNGSFAGSHRHLIMRMPHRGPRP